MEQVRSIDDLQAHAIRDLKAENFRDDQIGIEPALDMRYAGQGYEITIACDNGLDLAALRRKFDDSHKQMFGHTAPEEPVEIVSYRLRGIGRSSMALATALARRAQNHEIVIALNNALGETIDAIHTQ